MLSREERILSELLVARGLVAREAIESCAKSRAASRSGGSLVDALIDSGELDRSEGTRLAEEAQALDRALEPELPSAGQLGEFQLIREIGRGGMGIVYEAEQRSLGRRVALKVLPAGAALDERLTVRFLREARAAGRLHHPGIVPVFTSGRAEGVLFFAMEMIDGISLADLVEAGPIDPERAARIAVAVARALDYAHRAGLVHRDVKPENILLGPDGEPRITDFGLVHDLSGASFTLSHHVLGTPAFIPPEQALGEGVDPRSDVYSVGAVLYTMLCGHSPYPGDVPSAVLGRVISGPPPRVASIRPDAPPDLAAICEHAMARRADDRYPTAVALAEDLERYLRGERPEAGRQAAAPPVPMDTAGAHEATVPLFSGALDQDRAAVPSSPGAAPARAARTDTAPAADPSSLGRRKSIRRRAGLVAGTLAGLVLLSIALASFVFFPGLRPDSARTRSSAPRTGRAMFTLLATREAGIAELSWSPDGGSLAYASDAAGRWDVYLEKIGGGPPVNLTSGMEEGNRTPAFSPDGRIIAHVSEFGTTRGIVLHDLESGSVRRVVNFGVQPNWSPDGSEIVFADQPSGLGIRGTRVKLYVLTVADGSVHPLTGIDGAFPTYSTHGRSIAFMSQGAGQADIWTIGAHGGAAVRVTDDPALDWCPVWSHDSRYLYFGSDRGGSNAIWRVRIDEDTGKPLGPPEPVSETAFSAPFYLASSRSGRLALVGSAPGHRLHRMVLDPGLTKLQAAPEALQGHAPDASFPDLSPDGRFLVFSAAVQNGDIAVVPIDGEAQARLVTSDPFRDTAPRWSPDGVRIAFCSDREGGNGIWTIDQDGTGLARVAALEGPGASFPVWSPGGDRIAFAQGGASPRLARAGAGGGPAGIEPLERADVTAPAGTSPLPDSFEPWSWSSDGDRIAGTAGGIGIYTLSDGAYRKMSTSGAHPTWLPDGQHLLYTDDRTLYLLDTRTRESRVLYDAIPEDLPFGVTVAKDGRTVYASLSGTPGEIWEVKIKE